MPDPLANVPIVVAHEQETRISQDRIIASCLARIETERQKIESDWQRHLKFKADRQQVIRAYEQRIRVRKEHVKGQVWKEIRLRLKLPVVTEGFTPPPREPQQISVTIPSEATTAQSNETTQS